MGLLSYLLLTWGVITAVLAVLLIYRYALSAREDDQIFIDKAEEHMAAEQREIVAKMNRLARPIVTLAVLSGILLLASAGVWVYEGLKSSS